LQSMKNFEIFREMIFHMSRLRTNIMLLWWKPNFCHVVISYGIDVTWEDPLTMTIIG
jgi:hypothetical protein